jgi:glycosyltransferase involved in cell wall biosynthesis
MNRYLITNADLVISVSNYYANFVKESFKINRKINVLYNGIDQNIYKPLKNTHRDNSILFIGRLEIGKGIEVIAETIPKILDLYPDIKFIFAGKTTMYKNTKITWSTYLKDNVPSRNLILLDQIPTQEVIKNYQRASISVFPSLNEAGGAAALESMACGCPTIATRVGGFIESIESNVDGLLIPPNDSNALAEAIIMLLTDSSLRERISLNGINKVTNKFNLNSILNQTIELYADTIRIYRNKRI